MRQVPILLGLLTHAAEARVLVDAVLRWEYLIQVEVKDEPKRDLGEHHDPSEGLVDLTNIENGEGRKVRI